MNVRTVVATIAVLLIAMSGLVATSSAASAHNGGPPDDCQTVRNTGWGIACFEWAGDDVWVRDESTDGHRVGVQLLTDYGKERTCVNTHGDGYWHECTHDHREGSCVQFRLFRQITSVGGREWTAWSREYSVRTGNPC